MRSSASGSRHASVGILEDVGAAICPIICVESRCIPLDSCLHLFDLRSLPRRRARPTWTGTARDRAWTRGRTLPSPDPCLRDGMRRNSIERLCVESVREGRLRTWYRTSRSFLQPTVDGHFDLRRQRRVECPGSLGVCARIESNNIAEVFRPSAWLPVAISYRTVPNLNKSVR
jgi:hypothetical protein